jgi:nucleoporin NUP82
MAIVTPHTIHIAVLPDSCHLAGPDFSPIKLKTYQLGPTTHVIPEAPVIAALWHPLGVYDNSIGCIVTVTTDAVVRLWEIDRRNHWSFDRPTLAVDLKKLADGTSLDQDFAPSGFGQTKGFSADSLYMEVAAACFGGHGYDEEDAWAPMTLWVAMSAGDIYALCPLLPTKWQVPSLTIPCLTTSIIHKVAAVGEASDTDDETRAVRQQYEWLQELDTQEPLPVPPDSDFTEVRNRPANPSPIPRLQGPFQFDLEQEPDDLEITDIFVIAAKPDLESLASEDDVIPVRSSTEDGLSATVICLATSTGVVHICLEVDGVEAQWLPKLSKGTFTSPSSEPPELILVESLETLRDKDKQIPCWPTFTEDLESRYHMLVTSAINVTHISLTSWAQRLESEFQSQDAAGSGFRVKILCEGDVAERQRLVQVSDQKADAEGNPEHFAASLLLRDYDLGYLLLTYSASGAYAIQLESPESADYPSYKELSPFEDDSISFQPLVIASQRSPYQVSSALYAPSPLDSFIEEHVPHGHRHTLKDPMRFSPATLDIIAAAHRVLSAHTHALEKAASDLFRRCERLQGEMNDQLTHLVDIAERINDVSNGTVRGTQRRLPVGREQALDSRMDAIESRQKELLDRYNSIRTKIDRAGGRPMSDKEKIWVREIEGLSKSLGLTKAESQSQLIQRLKKVRCHLLLSILLRSCMLISILLSRLYRSPESYWPKRSNCLKLVKRSQLRQGPRPSDLLKSRNGCKRRG